MSNIKNLVWLDLEMTGLKPEEDTIIEIATVVTDPNLEIIVKGPSIAIYQTEEVLENMNAWCVKQHNASGLVDRIRQSTISINEAEKSTLEFLSQHVKAGSSPLCGNSVCMDRRFLAKYMPELEAFFHYRLLDVSTLKNLAILWKPKLAKFKKREKHLALEDIIDSIEELKYYREHFIENK